MDVPEIGSSHALVKNFNTTENLKVMMKQSVDKQFAADLKVTSQYGMKKQINMKGVEMADPQVEFERILLEQIERAERQEFPEEVEDDLPDRNHRSGAILDAKDMEEKKERKVTQMQGTSSSDHQ